MSFIRRAAVAVMGVLVLAGAVPTTADVALVTQQVYFRCGESKSGNVDGGAIGWSQQAPATSATAGGGCATADIRGDQWAGEDAIGGVPINATFAGTFSGRLDSLTVRAWNLDLAGQHRAPTLVNYGGYLVGATVVVDGETVLADRQIMFEPQEGPTAPAHLMQFTLTGLGLVELDDDRDHTVSVTLDTWHQSEPCIWVYDATEVDSGIVFNPASPAGRIVQRDPAGD